MKQRVRSFLDHAIEVDMVATMGNVRRDCVGRGRGGESQKNDEGKKESDCKFATTMNGHGGTGLKRDGPAGERYEFDGSERRTRDR